MPGVYANEAEKPAEKEEQAETRKERPERERGGRGERPERGSDLLTPEERTKLRDARDAAKEDPEVKSTREALQTAQKAHMEAVQKAMLAKDPSLEPVLKKLQERGAGMERPSRGGRGPGSRPERPRRDKGEEKPAGEVKQEAEAVNQAIENSDNM